MYYCGSMQTIQVVFEPELLQEADLAAKKHNMNRSALIREALRAHLKRLRIAEMEDQAIRALQKHPQTMEELDWIETASSWQND